MEFRDEIIRILERAGVAREQIALEVPPSPDLGDFAFPCFMLSKERKQAPAQIAGELAARCSAPFLERVEHKGPYVNFYIRAQARAQSVLTRIKEEGNAFGNSTANNEIVMVEYSQPNTHKAFHVGHLRGTSLGESLSRIFRAAGSKVIQANYSGDTGAHIAKWLWYYTTHDQSAAPTDRHELERWIANIYVRATQELAARPEAQEEVDTILRKLDRREPKELMQVYARTRQQSIDAFWAIYEELHAHFDHWFFESEVEERGKEISSELVERKIAKVDDGATIVDLEDENLGVWVLLRKDGTALYSAKDLALAEKKFDEYHVTNSIYVIGAAQAMHMQQLFATLRRMGYAHADKCYHLSYTEVRLPTGKMSSRTGQNLLYSDIHREVAAYASSEVRKRHTDWEDARVEMVARQVTIAALKWDMLAIHPNKTIVFDPQEATKFEGETGPYLQYTYARACSIRAKTQGHALGGGELLVHPREQDVLRILERFPTAIERAAREYMPGHVAHYAMDLAKAFNSFYHDCPVLQADDALLAADRLAIVHASIAVLGRALDLLAIDAPEEM